MVLQTPSSSYLTLIQLPPPPPPSDRLQPQDGVARPARDLHSEVGSRLSLETKRPFHDRGGRDWTSNQTDDKGTVWLWPRPLGAFLRVCVRTCDLGFLGSVQLFRRFDSDF